MSIISDRDRRIAREAGERAARIKTNTLRNCPRYDSTHRGCAQVEAWTEGFEAERDRLARLAAAGFAVPA